MGLVEYLLIAVGVIAAIFLMVTVVRRISAYYRQRHNMSVWAGVFMLAVAAVIAAFAVYHYQDVNIPLIAAAGVLLLFRYSPCRSRDGLSRLTVPACSCSSVYCSNCSCGDPICDPSPPTWRRLRS